MDGLWWGGALVLTVMGALSCWSAGVLNMEGCYRDACLFLVLAFIGLPGRRWPLKCVPKVQSYRPAHGKFCLI